MRTLSLDQLWEEFRRQNVKPMVLRDFAGLPSFVASDLDLAIREVAQLQAVKAAIHAFALKVNATVITVIRRSYVWQFKLLEPSTPAQIVIDIHPDGEGWRGPLYLTLEELFEEATEREYWFEPAPHHQAAMAFFQHLLWGGHYKKKYHALMPQWIAGCKANFSRTVANAFGPEWPERLIGMIETRDIVAIERSVGALRVALWRTRGLPDFAGSVSRLARFLVQETRFNLSRHGRWAVLVGPDGVGKTTVAAGIQSEVGPFFRDFRYHHWIPRWNRPLDNKVPPGGGRFQSAPPRDDLFGRMSSLIRLGRNVFRVWLGYLLRIYPRMLRQDLVLGDRYLFNYLIDPTSVRYTASPRWVSLALKLVPKPDLIISLVADPEVIHARKNELTPVEIAERLERARSLKKLGFRVIEISAESAIDEVISEATTTTIRTLKP